MSRKNKPPLCIYTLGRFALVKNGVPVRCGRKAPRRSFELLQVLIALGGQGVSRIQIEDALWPNAMPSSARYCFDMALHRLRRLLGFDCLHLSGGRLTLNTESCWVDAWELERRIRQAEHTLQQLDRNQPDFFNSVNDIMDMAQGCFLDIDSENPWIYSITQKIRQRINGLLLKVENAACDLDECETAMSVSRQALVLSPIAEEFSRRLMRCYAAHGRSAEALAVYSDLSRTLRIRLQSIPSPQTETLMAAIRVGARSFFSPSCIALRPSR